jgi:hypothetical protein
MGLHQPKEHLHSKGKSPDSRDSPQNGRKYLAVILPVRDYYTGNKKLSLQRINNPMKKWAHDLNREFSKEELKTASKYMKKYLTSCWKRDAN